VPWSKGKHMTWDFTPASIHVPHHTFAWLQQLQAVIIIILFTSSNDDCCSNNNMRCIDNEIDWFVVFVCCDEGSCCWESVCEMRRFHEGSESAQLSLPHGRCSQVRHQWTTMIDWLTDWIIDWLIDWLIDGLVDWLTNWLGDWLISQID